MPPKKTPRPSDPVETISLKRVVTSALPSCDPVRLQVEQLPDRMTRREYEAEKHRLAILLGTQLRKANKPEAPGHVMRVHIWEKDATKRGTIEQGEFVLTMAVVNGKATTVPNTVLPDLEVHVAIQGLMELFPAYILQGF
jgi:hypothetical protein